ncbi:MAG: hypothetical protein GT598_13680 [Bacteroidales bacterium]|nr:hypothetical protein [Bacteroidales bacterium]HPM18413.1 hypothetical protein [Bacteroidales bacterium]
MNDFSRHPLYRIHTLNSAMSSMWAFYRKNFTVLFIMSLAVSLMTQFVSTRIDFAGMQTITDPQEMLSEMRGYAAPLLLIAILNLLFTTVLQYYVIYNPVDESNNIVRSLVSSLRYFVPYIIILILLAFFGSMLIVLGLAALIVGAFLAALYVFTVYLFILPVMMSEGPSIANTISRTIRLAHRNFWTNAGWTAVFLVILIVVTVIFSGLILLPFSGSFLKVFTNPEAAGAVAELASNPLYFILTAVVNALVFPLMPVFACILYFNGRAGEDQISDAGANRDEDNGRNVRIEDLYARPSPEEDTAAGEKE